MAGVQVRNRDVSGEEEVHTLALIDELLAVGGQFNNPALIDFLGGLINGLDVVRNIGAVLNTAVVRREIRPDFIGVQAPAGEFSLEEPVLHNVGARNRVLTVDVGTIGLDRGTRAAHDEETRGVRGHGHRERKAACNTGVGGIGIGPALFAELFVRSHHVFLDAGKHFTVHDFRNHAFKGNVVFLQVGMKPHGSQAHASFTQGRITGALNSGGRMVDEVLQDVIEKLHHIVEKARDVLPLVVVLEVDGRQAAHGRALGVRRQENFRAEVGAVNPEALILKP